MSDVVDVPVGNEHTFFLSSLGRLGQVKNKRKGANAPTQALTHLTLSGVSGGSFALPDEFCVSTNPTHLDTHASFLFKYARDVVFTRHMQHSDRVKRFALPCVVERRPEMFRLMFDLDIVASEALHLDGVFSVTSIAQNVIAGVAPFFPEGNMYVSQRVTPVTVADVCNNEQTLRSVPVRRDAARHETRAAALEHSETLCDRDGDDHRGAYRDLCPAFHVLRACVFLATNAPVKTATVQLPDGSSVQGKKTGAHLIFPHVWVTDEQAKYIRQGVVNQLRQSIYLNKLPNRPLNNAEDVVDLAVYVGAGLRMPYSIKMTQCSHCKGTRLKHVSNAGLAECSDTNCMWGKTLKLNSEYNYVGCVDGDGPAGVKWALKKNCHYDKQCKTTQDWTLHYFQVLHDIGSIRTPPTLELVKFVKPQGVGAPPRVLSVARPNFVGKFVQRQEYEPRKSHKGVEVLMSDPRAKLICALISRSSKVYEHTMIRRIMLGNGMSSYLVNVVPGSQGAHYCANKRDDHGVNPVYFVVKPSGLYQCCYSNKKPAGSSCMCSSFKSTPFTLLPTERALLFPQGGRKRKRADNETARISLPAITPTSAGASRSNVVSFSTLFKSGVTGSSKAKLPAKQRLLHVEPAGKRTKVENYIAVDDVALQESVAAKAPQIFSPAIL